MALIPDALGSAYEFHVNSLGQLMRSTFQHSPRVILVNNHVMSSGNVPGDCSAALGPNGDIEVTSVQSSTGGARFYRYVWADNAWYDGNGTVQSGA